MFCVIMKYNRYYHIYINMKIHQSQHITELPDHNLKEIKLRVTRENKNQFNKLKMGNNRVLQQRIYGQYAPNIEALLKADKQSV